MTRKRMAYLALAVVLAVIGSSAWSLTARAAYETAEYEVVESDGSFEIRDYPDLMLASTDTGSRSPGNNGGFMRLFRYISGANEGKQKVAMTTPVFMEAAQEGSNGSMGFVIPKEVASQGAPKPVAENVQVRRRLGGRFAVIRFSGRMDVKAAEKAEEKLRAWMKGKGLGSEDDAETAGYDPPWTPGPFRRNEVLIRIRQ